MLHLADGYVGYLRTVYQLLSFYGTKQDKQRGCNVTLGRFHLTIVAVKIKGIIFYECASVDLVTQHTFHISSVAYYIFFYGLSGSIIFLFIIS